MENKDFDENRNEDPQIIGGYMDWAHPAWASFFLDPTIDPPGHQTAFAEELHRSLGFLSRLD